MKLTPIIQKIIILFTAAMLLMYIPLSAGNVWMKEAGAESILVPPITTPIIEIAATKKHDKGGYYLYKIDATLANEVTSIEIRIGNHISNIPVTSNKLVFEEFLEGDFSEFATYLFDKNAKVLHKEWINFDSVTDAGNEELVNIPDQSLRNVIKTALGKEGQSFITKADMLQLTELDASFSQITDLTGLEHAKNLKVLDLESNQLADKPLVQLGYLQKLERLILADNHLESSTVPRVSEIAALRYLDLNNTGVTSIDSLVHLKNLEELYAADNQIFAIKDQLYFGKLKELNLNNNKLTSAHFISSKYYPSLTWVDFRANELACETSENALNDLKNHQVKVLHDSMNCQKTVNLEISFSGNSQELIDAVQSIELYSYKVSKSSNWQQGSYYKYKPKIINGSIILQNVPFSDDYNLNVYSDKYVDYRKNSIIIDATTSSINIPLEKGASITGRVTDEQVNPLIGADIYARTNNLLNHYFYSFTRSGTGGFFNLTGVSKETGELQTSFPGYETDNLKLDSNFWNTSTSDVYNIGTILMAKEKYVQGRIFAADGKTPLRNVSVSLDSPTHWGGSGYTDTEGYFYIRNLKDQSYTLRINDYSGEYLPEIHLNVSPKPEPFQFILQKPQKGNFVGSGNSFVASEETVIPGKYMSYRLNYKNNGNATVNQAQLQVTIPNELEIDPQSVRLDGKKVTLDSSGQVSVQNVKPGEKGRLSFSAKIKETTVPAIITSGRVIENGVTSWTSSVTTNVLFVTLEAPQVTSSLDIKVYGKAKPGSLVKIYNEDILLAETVANSRLWYTDVQLVGDVAEKRSFSLHAVVEENSQMYKSAETIVTLDASVPKITSASIDASYNKNIKLNPYTGIASAGVFVNPYRDIPADPISVRLKFNQDIDKSKLKFMDREYPLSKTSSGYEATIKGDWLSYGDQLIEVEFEKNGQVITLPLMQVIVLIDPSGYVFEGSMENRLTDVEAIVEEKKDNVWTPWDAEMFGQINPQKTDSEGRYGWDVPAGDWQVKFFKSGYNPYVSRTVTVPPPEMDLNIPLKAISAATVTSLEANEDKVKVIFNRPILEQDIAQYIQVVNVETKEPAEGTFTLQNWNGYKEVSGQPGYYEEDESVKLSQEVTWTPSAPLAAGAFYSVIVKKELKDYAGNELANEEGTTFSTKAADSDDKPLPFPPGEWGEIIKNPDAVGKQKVWTIKLSKPVDLTDLKSSVFVVDKGGFPVAVQFTLENEGQHILVQPPKMGYAAGKYHLMVMDNLKDQEGTLLKNSVLMPFTVK